MRDARAVQGLQIAWTLNLVRITEMTRVVLAQRHSTGNSGEEVAKTRGNKTTARQGFCLACTITPVIEASHHD